MVVIDIILVLIFFIYKKMSGPPLNFYKVTSQDDVTQRLYTKQDNMDMASIKVLECQKLF
jgi:hypothetical protein